MDQRIVHIPREYAHQRLDVVLAKLLPEFSRTQLKNWIDHGLVRIQDKPIKAKMKLQGGETIVVTVSIKQQPDWKAQPIPLNIVYEDKDLLIINKPAGLVVHPGAGNLDQTLLNAILHHSPKLGELPRAGIIHRLDKNTSGLLVIAKTHTALRHLSHQLKKRELVREYQTIVYGKMISGGKVDAPIGRNPLERKRMAVIDNGKAAITHYRILAKYAAHTHLSVRLETGRTHQIRVHMAHIHHPIVGDHHYGGKVRLSKGMNENLINILRSFKRQALHAFALGFTHPSTGKSMRFEAELPEDMQNLLKALRTPTTPD